ncbi:MAG: protease inhibitor I42 family protein [Geminicoccaceae bacterium]
MVDLVLTDAEAGKTLQVAPQTVIELRLPENPTTGFRWIVTAEPEDCAVVQGDSYERPTSTAMGAGGERRLLLRSAGAVRCELVLTYRRSWEQEDQTARSLRYVLVPPG